VYSGKRASVRGDKWAVEFFGKLQEERIVDREIVTVGEAGRRTQARVGHVDETDVDGFKIGRESDDVLTAELRFPSQTVDLLGLR